MTVPVACHRWLELPHVETGAVLSSAPLSSGRLSHSRHLSFIAHGMKKDVPSTRFWLTKQLSPTCFWVSLNALLLLTYEHRASKQARSFSLPLRHFTPFYSSLLSYLQRTDFFILRNVSIILDRWTVPINHKQKARLCLSACVFLTVLFAGREGLITCVQVCPRVECWLPGCWLGGDGFTMLTEPGGVGGGCRSYPLSTSVTCTCEIREGSYVAVSKASTAFPKQANSCQEPDWVSLWKTKSHFFKPRKLA